MMTKRTAILLLVIWAMLIALSFRIFYISYGSINQKIAATAGTRTSKKVLYNSKGIIYDRNLNPIAGGQKAFYLIISPRDFDQTKINYISQLTGYEKDEILEKLKYESPFVLMSYDKPSDINGVYVYEGETRYPQKQSSQHIIGYLDNDGIKGLSGVERAYDEFLSKYNNTCYYSYSSDAVNAIIPDMDIELTDVNDSKDGVVTTIDKNLSDFAEQSLKENCIEGCVIVMNCNNGELNVLSSIPSFDVNEISNYNNSDSNELVNNALVNQTVGSVFKIIIAASAIQNNIDNFEYDCKGGIEVAGRVFSCQGAHVHGLQNLEKAFSNSCNCYFIAIGQLLGYDEIMETAQLFGLDSSIKIAKELYSYSGILPKDNGELALANLSIGQGDLLLSPLTVSRMTATVCNGGYLVNPTIYKGFYINEKIINESEYIYKSNILTKGVADKLREICIDCIKNGTGMKAQPSNKDAGGKTASAQTGKISKDGKEILNTYFTGFYPAQNPKYVITVFAKDGDSGSSTCAPVFKEICDYIEQNY